MPRTPLDPYDISGQFSDIKRQLHSLSTGAMLRNASMSDPDGVGRVYIGLLPDGDYGIEVRNADGVTVYLAESAGVVYPREALQITKWGDAVAVTDGAFSIIWGMVSAYATADAVQVQAYILADAATTGEARLTVNLGGTPVTAVQSIPAASGAFYEWKWDVPGMVAGTGPIVVGLEARRTSGAGNVNVYPPIQAYMTTAASIAATVTGL